MLLLIWLKPLSSPCPAVVPGLALEAPPVPIHNDQEPGQPEGANVGSPCRGDGMRFALLPCQIEKAPGVIPEAFTIQCCVASTELARGSFQSQLYRKKTRQFSSFARSSRFLQNICLAGRFRHLEVR